MKNALIRTAVLAIFFVSGATSTVQAHSEQERSAERIKKQTSISRARTASVAHAKNSGNKEQKARGPRIINGDDLDQSDQNWQWTVSIQENFRHFCGGTFISPQLSASGSVVDWRDDDRNPLWVVTAAHCVKSGDTISDPSDLNVASGNVTIGGMDTQEVEQIFVHPDYDGVTLRNDIALLKLKPLGSPRAGNKRVSLALANSGDATWLYAPYTAMNVMGWGTTETGFLSQVLQRVRVPIVDRGICLNAYGTATAETDILPGMICGGYSSGGYDSCQGDSGSNLTFIPAQGVTGPSRKPVMAGVVSWGVGCALPNLYGVYTSVLAYRDWIGFTVDSNL